MRNNNTYLGRHDKDLLLRPTGDIQVDEDHRIRVYQFIGRSTLLYAPQFRYKGHFYYYIEQTGCSEGEWDSWATFIKENAIKKCQRG